MTAALTDLIAALGPSQVRTGADMASYTGDWTGKYTSRPCAVVRPSTTAEVVAVMRIAQSHGLPVVAAGGRTGLVGGLMTDGGLMLSLDRMTRIRALRPAARVVVAEAGVVLSTLHDAAAAEDLYFPLWFGARGSPDPFNRARDTLHTPPPWPQRWQPQRAAQAPARRPRRPLWPLRRC